MNRLHFTIQIQERWQNKRRKIPYEANTENTIWVGSGKYKRRQNSEHARGPHDESSHGDGRRRRPPISCGPLIFSAFASTSIFCFGPILYFLLRPHIVSHFWANWVQNSMFFQHPCSEPLFVSLETQSPACSRVRRMPAYQACWASWASWALPSGRRSTMHNHFLQGRQQKSKWDNKYFGVIYLSRALRSSRDKTIVYVCSFIFLAIAVCSLSLSLSRCVCMLSHVKAAGIRHVGHSIWQVDNIHNHFLKEERHQKPRKIMNSCCVLSYLCFSLFKSLVLLYFVSSTWFRAFSCCGQRNCCFSLSLSRCVLPALAPEGCLHTRHVGHLGYSHLSGGRPSTTFFTGKTSKTKIENE